MPNAMVVLNFPEIEQIHYTLSATYLIHSTAKETALTSTAGRLPRYSIMSAKPIIAAKWIGCNPCYV